LGVRDEEIPAISRGGADVTEVDAAQVADDLVTKARQTAARITFVEDPALLEPFGGVAAILRFRI
jgi:peptide subunit release factor 1 (eRF1)